MYFITPVALEIQTFFNLKDVKQNYLPLRSNRGISLNRNLDVFD